MNINFIMAEKLKIFMLLLKKSFLVRKRHWIQSTIIQILVPIGLFLIGQTVRMMTDSSSELVPHNTYHDIITKKEFLTDVSKSTVIRYTPNNSITHDLMDAARICLGLGFNNVNGSATEDSMIAELQRDQSMTKFPSEFAGIVFYKVDTKLPKSFKYKLRVFHALPSELYDPDENGNSANHQFHSIPVAQIQMCLDDSYIQKVVPNPAFKTEVSIQQMPYPPYIKVDKVAIISGDIFAELARMTFLIILCIEITFPANEKAIGINILMSVNGVKNRMNLFSWLVSALIYSTTYLLPIIVILKHFTLMSVQPFLLYGNAFIVWIALFIHLCQVISFGYHIASYFWKPIHAIFVAFMAMTLMHIVANFVHGYAIERFLLYLGIIFPNFILRKLFGEFTVYETKLIGVSWSNLFTAGATGAPPEASVGILVIFSILGALFHFCMTIYIYNVRPGKYGIRKNPFYCFQMKKWNKVNSDNIEVEFESTQNDRKEFEAVLSGTLESGIRLRNLKKIYTTDLLGKSVVYALRGVSMDFYKSQITALLGHNGAGKTTMMSILSGLTDASEGLVVIDGKNIQTNPEAISKNIGLCPQENMVFPDLNVYQQLMFFGTLKGNNKPKQQLEREIDILLAKVNLVEKRNSYPQQLSGGQKRRLCLAMAVIGDANVLILDEPTSGMDAESKREVWDIVLKMRGEKTIIISTHDMEEADILGDRIAIMHTGKLKCYGTSMFLKKLYGNGQVEVTLSIESWCDVSRVITEMGVSADILSRDEGKIVLAIPRVNHLPLALDKLEISKKQLGITGISVSMITLEQVFLRVTRDERDEVDGVETIMPFKKVTGLPYFIQTFFGFFMKKIIFARKNPLTCLISLILPCLSFILLLLQYGISSGPSKPISLTLKTYSYPKALIHADVPIFALEYKSTMDYFDGTGEIIPSNISLTDALLNYAKKDLGSYRNKMIISAEFNNTGTEIKANGFYSGTALLSIPITINSLSNAMIKTLADDSHSIEASIQPLPDIESMKRDPMVGFDITLSMLIFLVPAVAMYVTQPLVEVLSGVKQLQFMTGAPKSMYWAATFCFDLIQYLISMSLLVMTFLIVDIILDLKLYYCYETTIFVGLLVLFGISVLPFVYLMSYLKKTLSTTINILTITPIVFSVVEIILLAVSLQVDNSIYKAFRKVQSNVFLFIPHVSFLYGHLSFYNTLYDNARCRRLPNRLQEITCISNDICCVMECYDGVCKNPLSYFEWNTFFPSLKTSMIFLACSCLFFFLIIFIFEEKLITRILMIIRRKKLPIDTTGMDELVLKEKNIVDDEISKLVKNRSNQQFESENILLVQGLKKNYGSFEAVRGTSFRVKEGECFGLLGVNGAGKSTSFKMLTGASIPTSGTMYLKQLNIANDRVKYLAEMGYCPQQDAIIDTLNTWDHLNLFACLRGIPRAQIKSVVKKWVTKLNLTACAAQPSGTYSGGNKRRLNIALALIGNPSLVLMDEPTTGVDPAARRSLWNTLKTCQDAGQSIILTSHSMEECEVLCNRLVIMVRGRLVCVGASQELKQRFGAGYNIHIKLIPDRGNSEIPRIKYRIESILNCKLIDENGGFIGYHVTDPQTTWTKMYSVMNELKNNYDCIEDFAVLSSTLEQLFIQFARAPSEDQYNGFVKNKWWRRPRNQLSYGNV